MKNTLFILSLIIWCSCSSEIPFDADRAEDIVATRTANLDEYSFEIYGGATNMIVRVIWKKLCLP